VKHKNGTITNKVRAFEEALSRQPAVGRYALVLFVSGSTPNSIRAIQNIRAFCEERLRGRYKLKVIDIYQHPEKVKSKQIVVIPTLLKILPLPLRKLIGDLSDKDRLLLGLDIVPRIAAV
jgi:circadian clock protein KaiB